MPDKLQKAALCLLLTLLLLVSLAAAGRDHPAASEDPAPLRILTATDLHYIAPELTDNGPCFQQVVADGDGKYMLAIETIMDTFAAQVIAEAPQALVLSGDLSFNGARASHEALAAKLAGIEAAGIPVLVLPGNHDLNNAMAARFQGEDLAWVESLDAAGFEQVYAAFGFSEATARDSASLSYRYDLTEELSILMLDVNAVARPGAAADETLSWAERQLRQAREEGRQVLAVSHQNLLAHSSLLSAGYLIENAETLLALYEQYSVIANLSGHVHLQHSAQSEGGLWELTTQSLALSPHQYGVLSLSENQASYETQALTFPGAEGAALTAHSSAFFRQTAYNQGLAELKDHPRAEEMADFLAGVNTAYFAGRSDSIDWSGGLYELWLAQGSFFSLYLQSIHDEPAADHNRLSLTAPGANEP